MIKKNLVLFLCSAMLLTGCSQNTPSEISSHDLETNIGQTDQTGTSTGADAFDHVPNETDQTNASESEEVSEKISESDTREPETVSLLMNKINGNEKISITMLGLCQYAVLKSESYTDTPEDGKVYLVIFLEISNHDNGADYFNPGALSARVDGKEINNCALFNQPESYETIFDHIATGEKRTGFIAWQVPSDWKNFQIQYDGWQESCALTVTADVTPDMLCNPPEIQ